jgi:hypothetical protein
LDLEEKKIGVVVEKKSYVVAIVRSWCEREEGSATVSMTMTV